MMAIRAFFLISALAASPALAADPTVTITSRVSDLMKAGATGGTQGFYLKHIGGSVLANQQEQFVFEPANTIALLEHFYALTQVAKGANTLDQGVFHYGNAPASCPDPPIPGPLEPLTTALREMMWHTDYARSRSVEDYFTRIGMNLFARDTGLPNTFLSQIRGCILTPFNRFTLVDAARIFEIVSQGALPNGTPIAAIRPTFYSLMSGKAQFQAEGSDAAHIWDTDLPNLIRQEAPDGMTAAQQTAYRDSMDLAYKTGSYNVCQTDCTQIQQYTSVAGWAKVPYCAVNGTLYNEFAFGVFLAAAPDSAWFAGKTTAADSTFATVKSELLREQIHAGLASCYGNKLAMITPPPGSVLPSRITGFVWSPALNADAYRLDAGSSPGAADFGTLQSAITSAALPNLPCDGRAIYVRLSMRVGGNFVNPVDYRYSACTNPWAAISTPAPGSNLGAASVTFRWNAIAGADSYRLDAGSFQGAQDIASVTSATTSATVNNLPNDGRTIYIRLTTHTAAGFQAPNDYAYANIAGVPPGGGNSLSITSVLHAATQSPNLSPTCLAVVTGTNFTSSSTVTVGTTKAFVVGTPTSSQITFLVPPTVAVGTQNVTVTSNGVTTAPYAIPLSQASPGLYSQAGTGLGRFVDSTGAPISAGSPASSGATLSAFAAGVGPLDSAGKPTLALRILVGAGRVSANIVSAAPAPGETGVTEIKFQVPAGTSAGNQPVVLTAAAFSSNTVQLAVGGPAVNAVLNAASFGVGAPVAPGSIASVFGVSMAADDQFGLYPSVTFAHQGSITFNGIPVPLFDVVGSAGQINILVPQELPPGNASVVVSNDQGISNSFTVQVAAAATGVFRIDDPSNALRRNAAVLIANTAWRVMPSSMAAALGIPQDCRANRVAAAAICGQPAAPGDIISIFATGLGRATPNGNPGAQALRTGDVAPANGSVIYRTVDTPAVTIGGVDAAVSFSGIAPGYAGLYQINVTVPASVPDGSDVPMVISMPGSAADTTTIAVKR